MIFRLRTRSSTIAWVFFAEIGIITRLPYLPLGVVTEIIKCSRMAVIASSKLGLQCVYGVMSRWLVRINVIFGCSFWCYPQLQYLQFCRNISHSDFFLQMPQHRKIFHDHMLPPFPGPAGVQYTSARTKWISYGIGVSKYLLSGKLRQTDYKT